MKRLRTHGLIVSEKPTSTTSPVSGQVIALGLKLKSLYLIPELSAVAAR